MENRFGFAGEQYDPASNLCYLRARFYNPVIGRFIQEDTYYGDGLNLYTYCHNNPVGYVDPSGHICQDKYEAIEYLRETEGLNSKEALEKYREYRKQYEGLSAKQLKEKIMGGSNQGASDIRGYRHLNDPSVLGVYAADPRLVVDMPYNGRGRSNSNSQGWLRDNSYYWREVLENHPEAFSSRNRDIILGRDPFTTAPINDATFRAYFPQYDVTGLRGKPLIHHHIGGGGQAYGIPSPLHIGSGGVHNIEKYYGIWGTDSDYANELQSFLE